MTDAISSTLNLMGFPRKTDSEFLLLADVGAGAHDLLRRARLQHLAELAQLVGHAAVDLLVADLDDDAADERGVHLLDEDRLMAGVARHGVADPRPQGFAQRHGG